MWLPQHCTCKTKRNGTFRRHHFGDAVSAMDVSAMDFRSTLLLPKFWTYTQCQPCSIALGKFLLLVFMAKVAKETCPTSKEKVYLAFDCKYASWRLPLSKLWYRPPPNACTRSPRGNLWHPAAATGVRTPGSNCRQGIGSTNRFVHRQATDRKKEEYTLKLAVKWNQNKLFQTSDGRETTPALRMTTKTLIKHISFAV